MTQQHRWILGGGLASGKSTVRDLLSKEGVATLDADQVGHSVLKSDGEAFGQVSRRWPEVVADGRIDRAALAAIVFGNPAELDELERITHPHIFGIIAARVEEIDSPAVVEMPVITDRLDTGWRRMVVDSPDEVKLERAVARGMDRDDAQARLARQPTRVEWLAVADMVIPNHGPLLDLEVAVAAIVSHL